MLPVILHHGLLGSGDIAVGPVKLSYFRGIDRAIMQRGHPTIVSRVHPTGPIELRARQLGLQQLGRAADSAERILDLVRQIADELPVGEILIAQPLFAIGIYYVTLNQLNFPLGAALSFILLVFTLAVIALAGRLLRTVRGSVG